MSRFRFRLRTLHRIRQLRRDEAQLRLAQAYEAEQILAQQRESIAVEAANLRQAQRHLCHENQPLDVQQIMQSQRCQMALQAKDNDLAQQMLKVREEAERRRQALVEEDRQVRVLDRLEERQLEEHRRAEAAQEIKRLDEVGATHRGGLE